MQISKNTYEDLLLTGHSIDYKRISISPYERFGKTVYQVNSDDFRKVFSKMYKDLGDAVDIFVDLKLELYRGQR